MKKYPKIQNVESRNGKQLFVTFKNGTKKIYDCSPLLEDNNFKPLLYDALFNFVQVDKHGYGIVWNDELDLSESELWINGLPAD
jgi:hypothetical protein